MKPLFKHTAITRANRPVTPSYFLRAWGAFLSLALMIFLGTANAMAQAAATPSQASADVQNQDVETANRKALESRAGKDAAKLMLRSAPDPGSVRIDGKPIGKTPLLVILPPGVYQVEVEGGPRAGYGRRQVDLLPKETREVVLDLKPRYPTYMVLPSRSRE
jgi:hypothetical protein